MRIVFRTDASTLIGAGHVMRSLTLAETLRDADAKVSFVTRRQEGNLADLLHTRGFAVTELATPQTGFRPQRGIAHAAWVGASWEDDARETLGAIRSLGAPPEWLVVDHYGLDGRWESALRAAVGRILAIDDLADRRHDCDLLLDQNLVEDLENRYAGKVPEWSASMLGPRYALLQPVYEQLHRQIAPRAGPVRCICIYFGGTDPHNLTQLALRAFLNLNQTDIEADVVIGESAPDAVAIRDCAAGHVNVRLHTRLPSLAPLMARADLAIGAAGSTSWERLCLGVPALVITVADNQRPVAQELHKHGLIRWLGHQDEINLVALQEALAAQLRSGADTASSRAGHAAVDGGGLRRVRAALLVDASTPIATRAADAADEDLLLEWANDPITRRNSFARSMIDREGHHGWLCARLRDAQSCLLLVAETHDGVPLGTVRFDRVEGGWRLNYSIGAPYRGRGLGRPVLQQGLLALARRHPEPCWIMGRVMAANGPSRRVFDGLGFEVVSDASGAVEYRRTL